MLALKTGNFWFYTINFPERTGKTFLALATLYFIVFFFSYHRIKLTQWMAAKLSGPPKAIDDYMLMCLAGTLVALAVPLRFMPMEVITKPSIQIAIAFMGIACAISGWVWSKHRASIPINIIVGAIVAISLVLSVSSTFGRRPLIGVALGFLWGAYYRRTWWTSPARMIRYMIPLTLAAALVVTRSRQYAEWQEAARPLRRFSISRGPMCDQVQLTSWAGKLVGRTSLSGHETGQIVSRHAHFTASSTWLGGTYPATCGLKSPNRWATTLRTLPKSRV